MSITHSEIVELASELAHDKTEEELLREGSIQKEEDMWRTDGCTETYIYKDEVQDLFNQHYDYFYDKISETIKIEN
jgi:hypothetical protein